MLVLSIAVLGFYSNIIRIISEVAIKSNEIWSIRINRICNKSSSGELEIACIPVPPRLVIGFVPTISTHIIRVCNSRHTHLSICVAVMPKFRLNWCPNIQIQAIFRYVRVRIPHFFALEAWEVLIPVSEF